MSGWEAKAIRAGLYDDHWEKDIRPLVEARIKATPYTNWSGD